MTGRGYTIFDTGIGRCAIAWGAAGIIGVQLPEMREIDTRRRLYSFILTPASFALPQMSGLRSMASPRCCAVARPISATSRWM
jgi:hypothetical protein